MQITYKELLRRLNNLSPEQLDQDAMVYVTSLDEFMPVRNFRDTDHASVLAVGSFFIKV